MEASSRTVQRLFDMPHATTVVAITTVFNLRGSCAVRRVHDGHTGDYFFPHW